MADIQRRQIAYKVRVSDILKGDYVRKEGWLPNSILVADKEVSRINLIATVVTMPEQELNYFYVMLDDGTGKITARSFDDILARSKLSIGDVVLVIARPREYNNERYLMPEVIRKIQDQKWIALRQAELQGMPELPKPSVAQVISIIRKYDSGDGAPYQQVIKEVDAEHLVEQLLKQGEVFEIRPGRLKVLE